LSSTSVVENHKTTSYGWTIYICHGWSMSLSCHFL